MINPDTLRAAGYTQYAHTEGQWCTHFLQKYIRLEDVKLYAINLYFYRFPGDPMPVRVSSDARLYFADGTEMECQPIAIEQWTIEQLEAWYRNVYEKLGGVPDRLNN